jgi:hypothetical protein
MFRRVRVPSTKPAAVDEIMFIKFTISSAVPLISVVFSETNPLKSVDIYNIQKVCRWVIVISSYVAADIQTSYVDSSKWTLSMYMPCSVVSKL